MVGVVTQDPHLFHDTLRANLMYARPEATETEVLDALGQAQIGHLVADLPDGLDTVIGERGYRLSGGEKQRVALARLMLKAPDIVVLDEATAHLDSESEAAVQRALRETLAGRTSLVIAHRLSTVREADELLVIDDGRIVERGTHASLLAENGLYAELYRTQFADQEDRSGGGRSDRLIHAAAGRPGGRGQLGRTHDLGQMLDGASDSGITKARAHPQLVTGDPSGACGTRWSKVECCSSCRGKVMAAVPPGPKGGPRAAHRGPDQTQLGGLPVHNELCERLGIEFPIFAFTHCRDVAAAVSNAGGMGVLGAVGFSADELEVELTWLDEHVGDNPYGVDIVIPGKYEGMDEIDPVKLEADLRAMIPEEHRTFAKKILADHGVPEIEGGPRRELLGWTAATAAPLVEVILAHPKVKLVANALGTPPDDVIAQVHDHGMLMAALAGSVKHALNHKAAGIDIVICQGSEGGGHTGDVGSIVLWPEVIDAVAPLPVLAAGGIGSGRQMAAAMVMGAAGVWTGSLWLTVEEADVPPKQMESYLKATSRDTVRSRSFTGKPCRLLKNDWTDAWEAPDNPKPLGMPLQMMVAIDCVSRGHAYPEEARDVNFNPCGQIIGRATQVRRTQGRGARNGRGVHRGDRAAAARERGGLKQLLGTPDAFLQRGTA